ncbi:hypothetical protein [Rhodococcus marinonascens]|uniref:hypothetical protein n=1 Tax=Rhodococcus marinonascens TaxID=38311 RepID=UPI000A7D6C51|nr:hypothetical protein [Rhodococcus marinonascens]
MDFSTAVLLFLAVELPIGALAAIISAERYRSLRRNGESTTSAFEAVVGKTVVKAIKTELQTFRSLWLWVRRRKEGVVPEIRAFGYTRGIFGVLIAFGLVTMVEIIAVHLLVPWAWLRTTLLIASLYGIVLLFSFVSKRVVHPHLLSQKEPVLREGNHVVASIPIEQISSAFTSKRFTQTAPCEESGRLYLPSQDGTNLDIELRAKSRVHTPGLLKKQRRKVDVTSISVHLDDPEEFVISIHDLQRESRESPSGSTP